MTYTAALDHLRSLAMFGARFGLEPTRRLAAALGNPQDRLRFIHVAGTNGKGSTCAMLEAIFRAAGYRVGLFTSPHLVSFRERIQVDRQLIAEADVARLVGKVINSQCLAETMQRSPGGTGHRPVLGGNLPPSFGTPIARTNRGDLGAVEAAGESPTATGQWPVPPRVQLHVSGSVCEPAPSGLAEPTTPPLIPDQPPTFFEVVTAMAMVHFAEQRCDVVIWETGLGGRLDATNIVTPLASVVTNIALDHQQWLGDTVAKIAAEKAGIFKSGVPAFTATDAPEAEAVLRDHAARLNAPFTLVTPEVLAAGWTGTPPELSLRGAHQRRNAALAVAVARGLQGQLPVSEAALRLGLATTRWAGRLQRAQIGKREFLLDGAHNVDGARALATAVREECSEANFALVLGLLADKEGAAMCKELAPLTTRIAATRVASNRTLEPAELARLCQQANPTAMVTTHESAADALAAIAAQPRVLIAGSLYLIGEAMERLGLDAATGERALNEWQSPTAL